MVWPGEPAREQRDVGRKEREAIHSEGGERPLSADVKEELSGGGEAGFWGAGHPGALSVTLH